MGWFWAGWGVYGGKESEGFTAAQGLLAGQGVLVEGVQLQQTIGHLELAEGQLGQQGCRQVPQVLLLCGRSGKFKGRHVHTLDLPSTYKAEQSNIHYWY